MKAGTHTKMEVVTERRGVFYPLFFIEWAWGGGCLAKTELCRWARGKLKRCFFGEGFGSKWRDFEPFGWGFRETERNVLGF